MNANDKVDRLKERLLRVYSDYGLLTHPEVVTASQQLDRALNELLPHHVPCEACVVNFANNR